MSVVEFRTEGPVAVITLNRPPVNAISPEVTNELEQAIGEADGVEIRAVVLTGRPHFAAGADITRFQEAFEAGEPDRSAGRLSGVVARLAALRKPSIAAVHGYALGGGLEVAMGCDFRYLADDAKVGQPEIKLGIIPGAGGTQRLPRLVGLSRAREIIYSGRFVEADEALRIGLADKVVPADDLFDVALADAAEYAAGATAAIAAAKRAINFGRDVPIEHGLQIELDEFAAVFASDDAKEGVGAFLEKRSPEFRGG